MFQGAMGGVVNKRWVLSSAMAAGLCAQLLLPATGEAEGSGDVLQQMQQLTGGGGGGGDLVSQLEQELGSLLGGGAPTGYVYVNVRGQRVEVPKLQDVPEDFRKAAEPVYPGRTAPAPRRPAGHNEIYKYKDENGREVFTNIVEQIPVAEREAARLDLSHVTLNSELGTEIQMRMVKAHDKLVDSEYCQDVRANAKTNALKEIWDEYAPLIICGLVLLFFVLASPFMVRRVGGPAWSRTLTFAIPALALAGFMMYSMTASNRAIVRFKHAVAQEDSCKEGALASSDKAGSLVGQLDLLKQMQGHMQSHLKGIGDLGNIGGEGPQGVRR